MNNNGHAALRRYLRRVRSWLPCPGAMKRMILSDIRENAAVFLQEHPEADYCGLEAQFGTPDRIAASYISDLDTRKLLRELRLKRRITTAVIAVLIAALLIWIGAAIASFMDTHAHNRGYWVVSPVEEYQEYVQ